MDQGQLNWIANFIWGIADDVLRDLYVRGKYRDVILPMMVLRRFDALLEPTKKAVLDMKANLDKAKIVNQDQALRQTATQAFYNTSKFTLRDLKARASRQQLKADFEAYLDGFSRNVQDILDNFEFRNQIPRLSKADALGTLIEKFLSPEINLSPNPVLNGDGSVKYPGMDNHAMGTIFEELVRRFNEENNEEAGEHWTPRDAVKLMARLIFLPIADKIESGTYLLYDGACGTGGMLTVAEETLQELALAHGKQVATHLYGQEINAETYAICKADLLLKGEGEAADNIIGGPEHSTLSNDAFPSREFDFMLSNPPYGKSWKSDLERMGGKDGIKDPRFMITHAGDPEYSLITRSSDGQMLFLANMLSKMKQGTTLGSRIAEVHNGSSLFTGDAGQGESNIRRWIIESDWLEAIVALPLNMFYNTGIATYIWVLSNRKPKNRKGKVQLIDATAWCKPLRKNLGKKNCELADEDIQRICDTFLSFKESEQSKIFPNAAFGYWKVTVERPLRLQGIDPDRVVHFAVDDHEVRFCTHLKGKASWFLPFDKGYNDGAGNPPNPDGIKTDYLWKRILTPKGITNIIENYAQVVEEKNEKTGRKKMVQIFPRYHQLDVVRKLLAEVELSGVGNRYLIQHSAGSGKSNSIAWLAHQLIGLRREDKDIFDSIIVVTDRRLLDKQIRDTIKKFVQVGATVGHAEHSGNLRSFIEDGKKIIISTVQKFPFILDEIGSAHRGRTFAIIIDEAHSSQGGRTSAAISMALAEDGAADDDETPEDRINRIMEARKILPNASYFAFTATPKNKTLEIFGEPIPNPDGSVKHRPFHSYTMKQAIQEGFILDVLRYYTPVESYYRLIKKVEGDPEFDAKRAKKKLRRYVEGHEHAIRLKAEIMVDHFHEQVLAFNKIGGQARAMVVTSGIERAIQYYHAIRDYLDERKSPHKAVVAFSGEHEYGGVKVTEASLNGFPSSQIADNISEDPYRFLVCADKFQTGYDEPLLHTMYVDKILSGIKAVQTLSRLNRAHPQKHDAFVLDFMNDADTIQLAFAFYYRTTILSEETDPNKLHDLKAALDGYQVYLDGHIEQLVSLYLDGADRDRLDPILDRCVIAYREQLDEDGQVDFKGKAKAFTRTYAFLAQVLPYTNVGWEKLSIFLNFLVPKLPAPVEEDLSKGILESIDMDSYRVEKRAVMRIQLPDADAEIGPVPGTGGGHKPEPELDRLSNILKSFNDQFGNIPWSDSDRIHKIITEDIPNRVAADTAYQNAKNNSDKQNARIEHDKALARVMTALVKDDTELFKQFMDNEGFRRWLTDTIFSMTYEQKAAS